MVSTSLVQIGHLPRIIAEHSSHTQQCRHGSSAMDGKRAREMEQAGAAWTGQTTLLEGVLAPGAECLEPCALDPIVGAACR
jgi:hypothetical protein